MSRIRRICGTFPPDASPVNFRKSVYFICRRLRKRFGRITSTMTSLLWELTENGTLWSWGGVCLERLHKHWQLRESCAATLPGNRLFDSFDFLWFSLTTEDRRIRAAGLSRRELRSLGCGRRVSTQPTTLSTAGCLTSNYKPWCRYSTVYELNNKNTK